MEPSLKVTEKHPFHFVAQEAIEGEQLQRFESAPAPGESKITYWILLSRGGPVIRRARQTMTFGDIEADALMIYTSLGKDPDIPDIFGEQDDGKAPE